MKPTKLILSIVLVAVSFANAQALPDSLWTRGNQAFATERYATAIESYERILGQGFEHELLYYNLGNAYYRAGQTGSAIWAYEKGLQFAPRQEDLKFNRDVAKTSIKDRIEVPDGFIVVDIYRAFKNMLTLRGLLSWGGLFLLLSATIYSARKIFSWNTRLPASLTAFFLVMALLLHLVALDKYWEVSDRQEGVIVAAVVEARSTPSDLGKMLFRVHEGLKVEITQVQTDWLEIILLDGKKGWVSVNKVRLL